MAHTPMLRSLVRARGVAVATIGMLALGVGALTTTFALVDAALVRQPPFADAERLAILYITRAGAADGARRERWSYPRVQLLDRFATTFEEIGRAHV